MTKQFVCHRNKKKTKKTLLFDLTKLVWWCAGMDSNNKITEPKGNYFDVEQFSEEFLRAKSIFSYICRCLSFILSCAYECCIILCYHLTKIVQCQFHFFFRFHMKITRDISSGFFVSLFFVRFLFVKIFGGNTHSGFFHCRPDILFSSSVSNTNCVCLCVNLFF